MQSYVQSCAMKDDYSFKYNAFGNTVLVFVSIAVAFVVLAFGTLPVAFAVIAAVFMGRLCLDLLNVGAVLAAEHSRCITVFVIPFPFGCVVAVLEIGRQGLALDRIDLTVRERAGIYLTVFVLEGLTVCDPDISSAIIIDLNAVR